MPERIYTTERLSEHISRTPDGFLLCEGVPINRTGEMLYNEREASLMPWLKNYEPDATGRFMVVRDEVEVFRPETLNSWLGKTFIVLHPEDGSLLHPDNWADHAKGTVLNVRRGNGDLSDCTLADVLVTTEDAIALILAGLREVSCGYDARYIQVSPGVLRQIDIVGNHVALVDKGRAGARCAIQDSQEEENDMSFKEHLKKFLARKGAPASVAATLDAMSTEEEDELKKKATSDGEGEETSEISKLAEKIDALVESDKEVHTSLDAKINRIMKHVSLDGEGDEEDMEDDPDNPGKKRRKREKKEGETEDWGPGCHTKDAAFKDLAVRSEILVPGFVVPGATMDAKPTDVVEAKRKVLAAAYATEEGKKAIERITGANPSFDSAPRATLDAAFAGASEIMATANNGRYARHKISQGNFTPGGNIAEINKRNRAFWNERKSQKV